MPSLYEGFSLPAIEAMCSGTPLVATDGGALPEVTGADRDTVFRSRKGDAGDLARVIAAALASPELRAAVGAAGRRRVIERWTWRRCAELTVEQYREVLAMPANIDKLRRNGRHLMLTIRFDELGLRPATVVLDVGSGFGRHVYECARRGARVVAARLRRRRSVATRDTLAAMAEAGEIEPDHLIGVLRGDARRLPVRRRQRSTS